jgi:hypothetical protein
MRDAPLVEILSFGGCPNRARAYALVERVARELDIEAQVRLIDVDDADSAQRLGFLGSPTVRVDGNDVEPGAHERRDYGLSCRLYLTRRGIEGVPDESWVRSALADAHA